MINFLDTQNGSHSLMESFDRAFEVLNVNQFQHRPMGWRSPTAFIFFVLISLAFFSFVWQSEVEYI